MRRVAAAVVSLLLVGAAPPPRKQAKITAIEVRLFDPEKGEFSTDVLKDGVYVGWNTFMKEGNGGIGRGDAMVLVKIAVRNPDRSCCIIQSPLAISAKAKGKLLAYRRFASIDTWGGEVARALYLQNIGCAGEVLVKAEMDGQSKAARLEMSCGE